MVREDTLTLMELFMKAVGMIIKWKDLVKWYILGKNLGIQGVGWIIKGMVMEHCTQIKLSIKVSGKITKDMGKVN